MEIIFDIITFCLLLVSILMNVTVLKSISALETLNEFSQRKFEAMFEVHGEDFDRLEKQINNAVESIKADNNRSLQTISERQDVSKPIKSNNWDSVKEAFKGPVRIEINERN